MIINTITVYIAAQHVEAQHVDMTAKLLSTNKLKRYFKKDTTRIQKRLNQLWNDYNTRAKISNRVPVGKNSAIFKVDHRMENFDSSVYVYINIHLSSGICIDYY